MGLPPVARRPGATGGADRRRLVREPASVHTMAAGGARAGRPRRARRGPPGRGPPSRAAGMAGARARGIRGEASGHERGDAQRGIRRAGARWADNREPPLSGHGGRRRHARAPRPRHRRLAGRPSSRRGRGRPRRLVHVLPARRRQPARRPRPECGSPPPVPSTPSSSSPTTSSSPRRSRPVVATGPLRRSPAPSSPACASRPARSASSSRRASRTAPRTIGCACASRAPSAWTWCAPRVTSWWCGATRSRSGTARGSSRRTTPTTRSAPWRRAGSSCSGRACRVRGHRGGRARAHAAALRRLAVAERPLDAPRRAGPRLEVPGAQCLGDHVFEYALELGDPTDADLLRRSQDYRVDFVEGAPGVELEPPVEELDGELVFSALKAAEDGGGVVLRVFNAGHAGADSTRAPNAAASTRPRSRKDLSSGRARWAAIACRRPSCSS